MRYSFVELPAFQRIRDELFDEAALNRLYEELVADPHAGAVIEGTRGLRKMRQPDPRRGKGKRGGLRVIYYAWLGGDQFWLFTAYDKDTADDLTPAQRKALRDLLTSEVKARTRAPRTPRT